MAELSYRDCLDEFDRLQEEVDKMPCGDKRAETKKIISDIRDLIIKAEVSGNKELYIERMEIIFNKT